ncbi:FeoA family protein [Marasmitruncus massiliensis]|jgi:ferrous iron transport protein A|uniref:FeoA family protein n=1 Tax=Marasmitruncus massiliensis TaxID=1944642 RepID=UPI000C79EA40|nr:FeoA family protein [Marasmitruncus massiliensis]MBE6905354.1 ferrous iron transport protein A [Oscillospiraceae bacterium]
MNEKTFLSSLKVGQKAKVTSLLSEGSMRRRLQDIGLIEGTEIECIQKSPAGDPVAYLIRGALIALRSEDSAMVLIAC